MEIVYLANGQKVILESKLKDTCVVRRVYDVGDGDEIDGVGAIQEVPKVYEEPPIPIFDEEIERLKTLITDLQVKAEIVNRQFVEISKKTASRQLTYDKYPALKRIDDFIAGKFTHIAFPESFRIEKVETCDVKLKLLTLFGQSNGDLEWRLNRFDDGSGPSCEGVLCFSHKSALDVIRKQITFVVDQYFFDKEEDSSKVRTREIVIEAAKAHGLQLDPNYTKDHKATQTESVKKKIDKLRGQITGLEMALESGMCSKLKKRRFSE